MGGRGLCGGGCPSGRRVGGLVGGRKGREEGGRGKGEGTCFPIMPMQAIEGVDDIFVDWVVWFFGGLGGRSGGVVVEVFW